VEEEASPKGVQECQQRHAVRGLQRHPSTTQNNKQVKRRTWLV
jgi:hypothetical protein